MSKHRSGPDGPVNAFTDVRRWWGFERSKSSTRLWGLVALISMAAVVVPSARLGLATWLTVAAGLIAAVGATFLVAAVVERRRRSER